MSGGFKVKWYQALMFPAFCMFALVLIVCLSPMLLFEWLWNIYRESLVKEYEEKHGSICKECGRVQP